MSILSATDLLSISKKPDMRDISLQTIQIFYKEHLCDRLFTYELDDSTRSVVHLRFEERHLCHLLGIQYVVNKLRNKHTYLGQKGYKKIESGSLDFNLLKKTDKDWFKSKRNRMLYFPFVYQIVHSPQVVIFSPKGLKTKLVVDIILYNELNNTYLHLGLDKDKDSDFYYPKSFFDRKKDDYIEGRVRLEVKNVTMKVDQLKNIY